MGTCGPRSGCRKGLRLTDRLRAHQNRNHSTRRQTKSPVADDSQNGRNLTRVTRHGDKATRLLRLFENRVQRILAPNILRGAGLPRHAVPELILLGETLFDGPAGEQIMDVGAISTVVAGVDAYALAEEFLDERLEGGAVSGVPQTSEGDVCGAKGSCQRADKIAVWRVDALGVNFCLPEIMGHFGLLDACGGQVGIAPGGSTVAV